MPSPAPCPTPQGCPTPEPCSEVLDSRCVIYSGANIRCGGDTLVTTNDSVAEALDSIINYFCGRLLIQSDILCGQDTVVAEDTLIEDALVDIVDYFCQSTTVQNDILCGQTVVVQDGTAITDALTDIVDYFCDEVSQIIPITSFRATTSSPQNINAAPYILGNSDIPNGDVITNLTVAYQLVDGVTATQYNPVTGHWTCPQTGKYDINYNFDLTAPDSVIGPGQSGWGQSGGTIQIGVTNVAGTSVYQADIISLPVGVPLLRAYTTGTLQGVVLNAGTVLVLRILNLSQIGYVTKVGNNIDWSIRRVG